MASYVTYVGNGVTTDFAVPFPYIATSHVGATVNDLPVSVTWLNPALLRISPAPANATVVRIARATPYTAPLVTWQDNANLKAADLTRDTRQAIYAVEDGRDYLDQAIADFTAQLDEVLTGSGAVPSVPSGIGGYVLRAHSSPGVYSWQSLTSDIETAAAAAPAARSVTYNGTWSGSNYSPGAVDEPFFEILIPTGSRHIIGSVFARASGITTTATAIYTVKALNGSSAVVAASTAMIMTSHPTSEPYPSSSGPFAFDLAAGVATAGSRLVFYARNVDAATAQHAIQTYNGSVLIIY